MTGHDRSADRNGQQFLCGVTASRSRSRGGSVASPVSASVASGHFVKHAASLSWV
jgi:hypothetical protein